MERGLSLAISEAFASLHSNQQNNTGDVVADQAFFAANFDSSYVIFWHNCINDEFSPRTSELFEDIRACCGRTRRLRRTC
jgi:hypothetical protein